MDDKKLLFIVNPRAGKTKSLAPLFDAAAIYSEAGYLVSVRKTTHRGEATELAESLGPEFDVVVCHGGDGTLNETVNGVMRIPREYRPLVSYLPDRPCLPEWMNTRQLMDLYADFYADFDRERAGKMLEHLNIPEKRTIKQMSKGTREKVQLILVMSRKAKLYLLDEPIGGVDPATRDFILNTIISNYNPEAAVVISTHLIADVENILDDVAFLSRGHLLLQSSADELRAREGKSVDAVFREVFRC